MGQTFEIKLKEITVQENGFYETDLSKASNFLEALLFYPRPGEPSVRSILELKLEDGERFEPQESSRRVDLPDYLDPREREIALQQLEFEVERKRLLFRHELEGECSFELNISAVEKVNKVQNVLLDILKTASVAALGTIPGLGSVVTAVVTSSTESIFNQVVRREGKIKSIGRGILKLDSQINNEEREVELIVPDDIRIMPRIKWNRDGTLAEGVRNPVLLNRGKRNGTVTVEITRIS